MVFSPHGPIGTRSGCGSSTPCISTMKSCQRTFCGYEDYLAYTGLGPAWCCRCAMAVWAYCPVPNHIPSIVVPSSEGGLRGAIGEAHRRYSKCINSREGWRGHVWQVHFPSYPINEPYLLSAARHVEVNPVRAGLVASPGTYHWLSPAAHLTARDDESVEAAPMLEFVPSWVAFLSTECSDTESEALRRRKKPGLNPSTNPHAR